MHPNSLANLQPAWSKENPPNTQGRRAGSRDALTKGFIKALAEDFKKEGEAAIVKVRENDPAKYLALIASLVPKDDKLTINGNPFADLTDGQLALLVSAAQQLTSADGGDEAPTINGECEQVPG